MIRRVSRLSIYLGTILGVAVDGVVVGNFVGAIDGVNVGLRVGAILEWRGISK